MSGRRHETERHSAAGRREQRERGRIEQLIIWETEAALTALELGSTRRGRRRETARSRGSGGGGLSRDRSRIP